jgi:hypothetical protein
VGPKASLDNNEGRKMTCLFWNSNPNSSAVQPVTLPTGLAGVYNPKMQNARGVRYTVAV